MTGATYFSMSAVSSEEIGWRAGTHSGISHSGSVMSSRTLKPVVHV